MRTLLVAALAIAAAAAQAPPPPPFEPIFDGKTLSGWRGDPAIWRVEDGCIVGSTVGAPIRENTFLVLDGRAPAHFGLIGEVKLEGDNNSGIQYRSRELDGGGFRIAGYQCDVNRTPEHLGMLYDERGGGIVAPRGAFVRWTDAGMQRLGPLDYTRPIDLGKWRSFCIAAAGDIVCHHVDDELTAAVQDLRDGAPRSGCIALQVHAGAPMTIRFRKLKLVEYADAAAAVRDDVVPRQVIALLRADELAQERRGVVPQWLWDGDARDGDERFFRRVFAVAPGATAAQFVVSCDNHCRVYVNGERIGSSDEWEAPLRLDVTKLLREGDNVIAVHAINDGGVAALAARLAWQQAGQEHELVTDVKWRASDDDPDGWNALPFDDRSWRAATVLAAVGDAGAPWTRVLAADAFGTGGDPFAPQIALRDTTVRAPQPGNQVEVERLLDVPRTCGSWVSLCADPAGRLYAGAERGGLYRIVPADGVGWTTTFERVDVELGGAHGLLWFRDALYAVVNGKQSGLYRVTDTNGDDRLDRVELLTALDGDGEHGPHSIAVAPDGAHLLVVCGNQTKLPKLASSRVPTSWREDRLLLRLDDPNPYWEGHSPPGGWVAQCDPDGKNWELICCGFRNPYDLVVLPTGVVLTVDSDMEWDMGLPWYRPTRLLAVHSGVDYGWRIGSAKWSPDLPEAPPALRDLGPGSPTGMTIRGGGVIDLDWTFGTIRFDGAPWLAGAPLPVADVTPGSRESNCYVVTGGRGLPSALLRIEDTRCRGVALRVPPVPYSEWGQPVAWPAHEGRTPREILDAASGPFARIALERLGATALRDTVLAVDAAQPAKCLTGLLALARCGDASDLQPIVDALGALPFAPLSSADRIAWLRVHALALLRLGPANDAQRAAIAQRLLPLFPTGDERQDQDLAELLAYVDAPGLLDKAVLQLTPLRPSPVPHWAWLAEQTDVYGDRYAGVIRAMHAQMPPIGQIAIADALRIVKHGWTLEQRRTYFAFLGEARTRKGGASYDGYLKKIIDAAWETCTPAEQQALAAVVGKAKANAPKFAAPPPKGPGRDWQLADAESLLREDLATADVARGRELFHAVSCASCHYFAGEGGNHGPDLTSLGNKFRARDVLEAILEPGNVVSEQYTGYVVTKHDGGALFGTANRTHHGDVEVWEVMPASGATEPVRIPVGDVAKVERSTRSPMPADLVDSMSAQELRDLLAFLLSRGRK